MDAVSRPRNNAYAKAIAAQDALLAAFAKEENRPKNRPDQKVVFNAPFQMLIAAQTNIDETRSAQERPPDQRALLQQGVGEEIDTNA